jgi:hypothetical protein
MHSLVQFLPLLTIAALSHFFLRAAYQAGARRPPQALPAALSVWGPAAAPNRFARPTRMRAFRNPVNDYAEEIGTPWL